MNVTMLVVDGDPQSRGAMARFFLQCGFRVDTAANEPECLAKIRVLHPDVLIVDQELPWGGMATLKQLFGRCHLHFELPDVFVIGHAPPSLLSERTGVPYSSCFQKPVRLERLLDRVGLAIALQDLEIAEAIA